MCDAGGQGPQALQFLRNDQPIMAALEVRDVEAGPDVTGKATIDVARNTGIEHPVIGAVGALTVNSLDLLLKSASVKGWYSGTSADSEDTLRFAELTGARPMIETYPLEKATEGYARMMSGNAQFRVVLTM